MTTRKGIDRTVLSVFVLGSLVLLNILGLRHFVRLDLTGDRRFTLGEATVTTLESLRDPVTIRAYFTADLPPPFSTNARYVRDLLEEYHATSEGVLSFEFIDPVSAETAEDKDKKKDIKRDIFGRAVRETTSVEQEMQSLGIPSVQVQVNEDDKLEVKRAYMGIAIEHGDQTEVIPMVQGTEGLEYDLTTLLRKLTREKTPKVGLLVGHDGPDLREKLGQAVGLLAQLYDVQQLDLSAEATIPDDMDAILVVGPTTPLSEDEQRALDGFITNGGSVAFLLDSVVPDLGTFTTSDADHGLGDLLETYGVTIEPGLVIDAEAATINVEQQRGFVRIAQPMKYPLVPQPKSLDPDHPLTRGLAQVVFPFMSPIEVDEDATAAEVLVRSSERSWVQSPPHDLNPSQSWSGLSLDDAAARPLVVALSGALPRHFDAEDGDGSGGSGDARVVVIGGSTFIQDQFLSAGNRALVLNLMDWLVLDEALLAIRARGLAAAPLGELDEGQRATIRYANVIGLPLAFVLFGIVRWRMRERRRALVHV